MQKTITKKIEKIICLGVEISFLKIHDVFVDYSGHVNLIDVRIYLGGWRNNENADLIYRAYLDSESGIKMLDTITKKLKELKEEKRWKIKKED